MTKVYILTVLLLHRFDFTTQDITVSQQPNCSEYLTNMTKSGTTNLLGLIEIPSTSVYDEYYLKIALNTHNEITKHNSLGIRDFRLELAQTLYDTIRDVRQGKPLLYHIYYPSDKPIPTVTAIWFNNQQICPDLGPNGNINATIELGHIVYPPSDNSWLWYRNSSNYRIDNPNQDRLTYLSPISIRPIIAPSVEFANNECGITNYYTDNANRLYPNSQEVLPGQWPWVVAIFKKKTEYFENDINFRCAGSLLTTTHVITAAFCFRNIILKRPDNPNNFIVALGVHHLYKWNETNRISREVTKFTIHPDHGFKNKYAPDSNLAIVSLNKPVEYSPFIKPICLRSASTELQNVFNNSGYNVGWDKTCCDFGFRGFNYPRMARVSIMSQATCFQGLSNAIKSYYEITSLPNRTFCADEHEDGFCNNPGGSGNGLFIFDDTTGRYYLHGIRSRSTCNSTNYVLYDDVVEYIPWIQQQISIT
ncbi:chymotrypsin-like elastase family member 2B [Monomorium pharaonis]|uniref:chymotrypsin-like elastase family member 2B n=1 Tax=Monomorium pharaonis TaxID=307658 RepID=UPI00063F116F|nr:chymotrypsin-like elastase family member 2B [Monomorium pharaonis]XP_036145162.1 chymotrypsin-like elastase family member 2B [Monomorium pharaonis]